MALAVIAMSDKHSKHIVGTGIHTIRKTPRLSQEGMGQRGDAGFATTSTAEEAMQNLKFNPETLPDRMRHLPVAKSGWLVPWFVALVNGEPEFRAMDGEKFADAIRFRLCWVCGEKLGIYQTFTLGPMCAITRTTSEPPSHLECARWSANNCPFLTQRQIKYREGEFTKSCPVAGFPIKRQPGVALLWTTLSYKPFRDGKGGVLITVGEPLHVEWFSHARAATRAEVVESVESGFPILEAMAREESAEAMSDLMKCKQKVEKLYPVQ